MITRELAMQRIDLLNDDFLYPVYPNKGSVSGITAFLSSFHQDPSESIESFYIMDQITDNQ